MLVCARDCLCVCACVRVCVCVVCVLCVCVVHVYALRIVSWDKIVLLFKNTFIIIIIIHYKDWLNLRRR